LHFPKVQYVAPMNLISLTLLTTNQPLSPDSERSPGFPPKAGAFLWRYQGPNRARRDQGIIFC
jgi:hypothetical protein